MVKEQVVNNVPKRVKELKFGILSSQDIVNQAVIEVSHRNLYELEQARAPVPHGPLDPRLGTSSKTGTCDTCGEDLQKCNGHFGHVKLALPVFHVGYLKLIILILHCICKSCSHVLLSEHDRRTFLKDLRRPHIDNLRRTQICKKVQAQCRKTKQCFWCGAINGQVKKGGVLKIVHDRYKSYNSSTAARKVAPESKVRFEKSFDEAKKANAEIEKHVRKAMDDLNPLRVYNLFRQIPNADCELLGMNPAEGRPEMFLWQHVPAPPISIRPSVAQDAASTEDDLTVKLADIVHINSLIRDGLLRGQPVQTLMEQWEFLQLQMAMYINSDVPGLQQLGFGKAIRGFCQRLKGKQGRFRGNLSGKRVDFSGRTVISPDPNLGIDQVAVPILVAQNLTYPERVSRWNKAKLQQRVRNGALKWPGANYVIKKGASYKMFLKFGNTDHIAQALEEGDVVERHLEDRDIVLFNRQPSLHKLSILSHYVKVRPSRTFRLNECVCTPYNADFDGDEMNLHVPQTEEARTEAIQLMGVKHNLLTPKNGEPIISPTQDFITAAYLFSSKNNFFDRKTFTHICMAMVDASEHIDLPPPALIKPEALWTGKQVFSVLMRPNKKSPVLVNLDARCREYKAVPSQTPDLDPNDAWLVVRNSEVMCGVMDKSTVGSGKKDSIFYVILRDFGPDEAVSAMNRLAKLSARHLTNQGFSIGISDVYPNETLRGLKDELVKKAYKECDKFIAELRDKAEDKTAASNTAETIEINIGGFLTKVRQQAGEFCISTLSRWNSPLIMAKSGSKGSNINVAQMIALVGQQIIGQGRIPNGFQDRTLPHFPKHSREPLSKGFVRNSFFSGLTPTEFLFHAMTGREGLVDTAVKTAETGYMSRRLMKSLEDLSTQYDDTVRSSSSDIVQFQYGDDKLDPVDMEGSAKPVNFERMFTHAESLTWSHKDRGLLPVEIVARCNTLLAQEETKLIRKSMSGKLLPFDDYSDKSIDQLESTRDFLQSIRDFVRKKAQKLADARKRAGLGVEMEFRENKSENVRAWGGNDFARLAIDRYAKLSEATLREFVALCLLKYKRAYIEPCHPVGPVAAQSIGEPGTQMTLKTFHFAGVADMNITQGIPRIKEIINASRVITTPVITCELHNKIDIRSARMVKGRIEKTYLRDVLEWIEEVWWTDGCYINMKIDLRAISKLLLDIDIHEIASTITRNKKLKLPASDVCVMFKRYIRVYVRANPLGGGSSRSAKSLAAANEDLLLRVVNLKRTLPALLISGHPDATRAIIKKHDTTLEYTVKVEGYGLKACMATEGVVGTSTTTNSILEVRDVLGIEAARSTIIAEIRTVMADMDVDPRHIQLLADVMTYRGDVLGITRFGLAKMSGSVLQLASFEKTADHLFDAAAGFKSDPIEGVSECIIMGQTMKLGTGGLGVVRQLALRPEDLRPKETVFENLWRQEENERRKQKRQGKGGAASAVLQGRVKP